ncbi:MAG: hypothetical protein HN712_23350 [Gemmatimonadetes bacterium]|jgi:hypothetical protein|nr:hypothetical protein [Gemmatimonadota bacterium]MBT7863272.1 hypothetical protein [Gemmatimonadota bacterium]
MTAWAQELADAARTVSRETDLGQDKARAYWELGRLLHEQLGDRATYGEQSIDSLARQLGLLPRTLYRARRFYQRLPNLTTWSGLSWSHCRALVTLEDEDTMARLLQQTRDEGWSVRRLQEQIRAHQSQNEWTPRRGRLMTYRLVPDLANSSAPSLDLGFGLQLQASALGALTERAQRLVETADAPVVVEWVVTDQGADLRPVWGAADQRLYTYELRRPQFCSGHELDATLVLGPHLHQRRRLQLTGVPRIDRAPALAEQNAAQLQQLVGDRRLVVTVQDPGPPTRVDLFVASDEVMTPAQVAAQGDCVNLQAQDLSR